MNPSAAAPSASSTSSSSSSSSWFSGLVRGRSGKLTASSSSSVRNAQRSPITGELRGVLLKYGPKPAQVAFRTGDFNQQVIFIGGLTDGLLATEN